MNGPQQGSKTLSSTPTLCSVDCKEPAVRRGMCSRHYQQWRTHERKYNGTAHKPAWVPDAVKRGRPATPYSADAVRKALKTGYHPKYLRMASGTPTLAKGTLGIDESRKIFGKSDLSKEYEPPNRTSDYLRQPYKVGEATQSYRYPKRASGQEECVTCRTGTREEHLHSHHVKPQERSAHLKVKPAGPKHITTNVQPWNVGGAPIPAAPAPRYELKRKDIKIVPAKIERTKDLCVPRDHMIADSEVIQNRLHGFDAYNDLDGVA